MATNDHQTMAAIDTPAAVGAQVASNVSNEGTTNNADAIAARNLDYELSFADFRSAGNGEVRTHATHETWSFATVGERTGSNTGSLDFTSGIRRRDQHSYDDEDPDLAVTDNDDPAPNVERVAVQDPRNLSVEEMVKAITEVEQVAAIEPVVRTVTFDAPALSAE